MDVIKEIHDEGTKWQKILWYNEEGDLHREDGPAVELALFGKKEWWVNGKRYYTEEEYKQGLFKMNLNKLNEGS